MSETKTLNLSIGERLAAMKLFDAFKGSITTLATLLDDVKLFTVTSDEWAEANLKKTPSDEEIAAIREKGEETPNQTWKWDDTVVKDIVVQEGTVAYLTGEIKRRSDAEEITLADVALVTLAEKLK